jgi:hypothetical protein
MTTCWWNPHYVIIVSTRVIHAAEFQEEKVLTTLWKTLYSITAPMELAGSKKSCIHLSGFYSGERLIQFFMANSLSINTQKILKSWHTNKPTMVRAHLPTTAHISSWVSKTEPTSTYRNRRNLTFLTENITTNVTFLSTWQVCKPGALISNAVKV